MVRIDILALVRFWNNTLSSQQKATNHNPIVYMQELKKITGLALCVNNEINAIAKFAHEIYHADLGNYDKELLAFYATLFLMEDNQQGRYVGGGRTPLCNAFNSVEATVNWINENYDLETF